MLTPEQVARQHIDAALEAAGWVIQNHGQVNLAAARGVAVREFPLKAGYGSADYLLFVDNAAVGVIEAKKEGETLTGVEVQAARYGEGVNPYVRTVVRPLPFIYQSTGVETRFTNLLDPEPRSRRVFHFHQPATFAEWLTPDPAVALTPGTKSTPHPTLRACLRAMPEVPDVNLWPAQLRAVENLEASLAHDRPRSLIQMATGSGKTYTAVTAIYRLIKFGGARRVLFLVDRSNLGEQAYGEFAQYTTPDDGRKFTELYNVQHLQSNTIQPAARVVITTIQRLYSLLSGQPDLDPALEEGSQFDTGAGLVAEPVPVRYNPAYPIETFDVIFTDECHRSIYNLWRQVLEYFDAHLVGLTATPSKQTIGFFNRNLVMEYNHAQAVADGVNVDFDVYRIQTKITERGAIVDAGETVDKRDRSTRDTRWETLDEDLVYPAGALDRDVVAMDQIRTVIRTFRDDLYTKIFPGRSDVPKTLIFAKDDSHADDIVQIVREEFGRGNDFAQKITYKTGNVKPKHLLAAFRNSYNPRVAVTVDMIATGTDIKPLEVVMFMRAVKSRTFFEQMKGRGVRVIDPDTFQSVTMDAKQKTHFVLVDCVGVTEAVLTDAPTLERKPSVALDTLFNLVAYWNTDPDVLSTLAGRLVRLDRLLDDADRATLANLAGGLTIKTIAANLVASLDVDRQVDAARVEAGLPADVTPTQEQVDAAGQALLAAAIAPLATNPELRSTILALKSRSEQTIDRVTLDEVLHAGHSTDARERAESVVTSFKAFIAQHRDEITALQVFYAKPYAERLRLADIRALANQISRPPYNLAPDEVWRAYETLDRSKVRGSGGRQLTDIVSLLRYTLEQVPELVPYTDAVNARFDSWLTDQEAAGREFTPEQLTWLGLIRDQIASSLRIEPEDFDDAPFAQHGGLGRLYRLFGTDTPKLLDELNEVLAA